MNIVLTLIAALAVGLALTKAKLPGGMMIGAVIGACVFGLLTNMASAPAWIKTTSQILAGAMIGSGVSRAEAKQMKHVVKPALILMPSLLVINVIAGLLIHKTGSMDMITALMSTTPGGISNIPMIAADLGADTAKVTVLQFVRLVMGIALFPSLIGLLEGRGEVVPKAGDEIVVHKSAHKPLFMVLTFAVSAACGLLGSISPIPSGTMAFSTLGTIAFKCLCDDAWTPKYTGKTAQLLSGAYVGALMGIEQVRELIQLPIPALIILVCYTIGAALISQMLFKSGCFARKEAMLASTPAGASDMALISADLGVHNANLVLLQALRLIVVVTVFPPILNALAGWL